MTDSSEFVKLASHKEADINLDDIDDLLAQLTQEELDELNGDFDPDVSLSFIFKFV